MKPVNDLANDVLTIECKLLKIIFFLSSYIILNFPFKYFIIIYKLRARRRRKKKQKPNEMEIEIVSCLFSCKSFLAFLLDRHYLFYYVKFLLFFLFMLLFCFSFFYIQKLNRLWCFAGPTNFFSHWNEMRKKNNWNNFIQLKTIIIQHDQR